MSRGCAGNVQLAETPLDLKEGRKTGAKDLKRKITTMHFNQLY